MNNEQPIPQQPQYKPSPLKIKFKSRKYGAIVPDGNSQISYQSDHSRTSYKKKKKQKRHRGTLNPGRYCFSDEEESEERDGIGTKRYGYTMNSGRFYHTQLSLGWADQRKARRMGLRRRHPRGGDARVMRAGNASAGEGRILRILRGLFCCFWFTGVEEMSDGDEEVM